jgi:uncharacterized protein (DUF697 family)
VPSIADVGTIFKTIREVDLTPIREAAEQQTWIAIVGTETSGARDLATALYLAPRPLPADDASYAMAGPILISVQSAEMADRADLVIFVLEQGVSANGTVTGAFQKWIAAGKKIIVIFNESPSADAILARHEWFGARVLEGEVVKREFLEKQFVPAVLTLLPESKLSLARNYPLFRSAVAKDVINETAMANASYSFSTGLAEIIPVLNIPFNVADMIVLTKAQAFMVYRLGLVFGLSTRWQDHLAAFGSTVGAGFLLRTAARQLVGLIPGFGIVPKVAIAYAGTYAMGRAALQWYETGGQATRADAERFFREALEHGKSLAVLLAQKAPKFQAPNWSVPRLPFRKKKEEPLALASGETNES